MDPWFIFSYWVLSFVVSIMLKLDVLNISVAANGFSISSKVPKMDQFSLYVLRVSSRLRCIFNEFYVFFANRWFVSDFYILNELEINVAFMLKIDVLSRFSSELVMVNVGLLGSTLHESIGASLRFDLTVNKLAFSSLSDCRSLYNAYGNALDFFRTDRFRSRSDDFAFNFWWSVRSSFLLMFFRLLISLSSDWSFSMTKQIIYHVAVEPRWLFRATFLNRRNFFVFHLWNLRFFLYGRLNLFGRIGNRFFRSHLFRFLRRNITFLWRSLVHLYGRCLSLYNWRNFHTFRCFNNLWRWYFRLAYQILNDFGWENLGFLGRKVNFFDWIITFLWLCFFFFLIDFNWNQFFKGSSLLSIWIKWIYNYLNTINTNLLLLFNIVLYLLYSFFFLIWSLWCNFRYLTILTNKIIDLLFRVSNYTFWMYLVFFNAKLFRFCSFFSNYLIWSQTSISLANFNIVLVMAFFKIFDWIFCLIICIMLKMNIFDISKASYWLSIRS